MILRDDGEIEFTSETSNCDDMPPLMDDNDVEYAHSPIPNIPNISIYSLIYNT